MRLTQLKKLYLLFLIFICAACQQTANVPVSSRAPQRIISFAPSTTEILDGIGAFDKVVAVSQYCAYPEQVSQLPRIGDWQAVNNEFLLSLKPDLAIVPSPQVPFVRDKLDALQIPVLEVPSQTLDDALNAILLIGERTQQQVAARRLYDETRAQLAAVKQRVANKPRPRVLVVADRVPGSLRDIYIATGNSFLAQLAELAGGDCLRPPDAGTGWVKVNKEALAAFNPDIIIDLVQGAQSREALRENAAEVWRELPQLNAVKTNRVHSLSNETFVLHPSQFVARTAQRFAGIIHDEKF